MPAAGSVGEATPLFERTCAWISLGILVIGVAAFADINRLLSDIHAPGASGFDASVFTRPELPLGRYERLQSAAEVWRDNESARTLIAWHAGIDVAFSLALCALLYLLLRWLRPSRLEVPWYKQGFFAGIPILVLALDEAENFLVLKAFAPGMPDADMSSLVQIHWVSAAKWLAITIALIAVTCLAFRPAVGSLRQAKRGGRQHPIIAMNTTWLTTIALFALIALPAGGPLDQMPDVIREQIAEGTGWWQVAFSLLALALLTASVTVAGLSSTVASRTNAPSEPLSSWKLLPFVLLTSVVLCAASFGIDGAFRRQTLALGVLFLFVICASWVSAGLGITRDDKRNLNDDSQDESSWTRRDLHWVGAAAGLVVVSFGLGIVRAALPLVILPSGQNMWIPVVIGATASIFGGLIVQSHIISWHGTWLSKPFWRSWVPALVIAAPVSLITFLLAARPEMAGFLGSPAVVAIAFSFLVLLLGLLKWLSNNAPPWSATERLGFSRTPWPMLLLLVWIVSTLLNEDGIYHDVRTVAVPTEPGRQEVTTAFNHWLAAQRECLPEAASAPLVLVAAPGGGIRAAFWTAAGLDGLVKLDSQCKGAAIFAISGVSGGSVGAAAWLRARDVGTTGTEQVIRLAKDASLAQAISGLLIRDLYQPFFGIASAWRDRSALLEDGWKSAASPEVFGDETKNALWSDIRSGARWMPHLILNSSSVTDGCRVLISTLSGLPASSTPDCFSRAGTRGRATVSIDPLTMLSHRDGAVDTCDNRRDIRVTTAALLSARFPFVSSSGAMFQCDHESKSVIYAVDGGYYENTGLLTLSQIWKSLEPRVLAHNASGAMPQVSPWIVVLENHYQESEPKETTRPRETIAPFRALGNLRQMIGPAALLQSMEVEIASFREQCPSSSGELIVIQPEGQPLVAAPLGWSLSSVSSNHMSKQLQESLTSSLVDGLRRQLLRDSTVMPGKPSGSRCRTPADSTSASRGED